MFLKKTIVSNKILIVLSFAFIVALLPIQSGICCQGNGATCDNEGQKCCPFDEDGTTALECVGIEEYGVGECKPKR